MRRKPGFFRRTRDAALVFVLVGVAVLALWVALGGACEARAAELIDIPYRAYDRFPDDPKLEHFLSEDTSERAAAGMVKVLFSENLMPSDDWLIIDCPMGDSIRGFRQPFRAGNATLGCSGTMAFPGARVAEIPQEHKWMAEHRGKFRCFAAYLRSASFPDTLAVLTNKGERSVAVWRSGREPRSEEVLTKGTVP